MNDLSINNAYEANLIQIACLNCETPFDQDELYCSRCGCILGHTLTGTKATNLLNGASDGTALQPIRVINLEWGTSYFHPRARLSLYHVELKKVIAIPISEQPLFIGRNSENVPGVFDLTAYGAEEYGVSRRHLKIARLRDFLQITDLKSSNGTFLNKVRLLPDVPYTLRNRAVLQVGHMILKVHFI